MTRSDVVNLKAADQQFDRPDGNGGRQARDDKDEKIALLIRL